MKIKCSNCGEYFEYEVNTELDYNNENGEWIERIRYCGECQ